MKVVISFICNTSGQLLITQRALDSHYGGYWELPGGKIEDKETAIEALRREVKEELGFTVNKAVLIATLEHTVDFFLYHVQDYSGTLSLNAKQLSSKWVLAHELDDYSFPETNQQFFEVWFEYLKFNDCKLNSKG